MLSLRPKPCQGRNSRQGTKRVLLSIAPKPSRNSRPISPLIDYVGIALKSASRTSAFLPFEVSALTTRIIFESRQESQFAPFPHHAHDSRCGQKHAIRAARSRAEFAPWLVVSVRESPHQLPPGRRI